MLSCRGAIASKNPKLAIFSGDSESESVMSEEDNSSRKEEMKKSIFMKRKSSVSPRSSDESKRSPERKTANYNPFRYLRNKIFDFKLNLINLNYVQLHSCQESYQ